MSGTFASYPVETSVGTVTSVGLADTSTTPIYAITHSPVVGSGVIDMTLKTEAANLIFSGPTTGADAQPTFRSLVAADLPTGNLTDAGTDGITVTSGTGAVVGSGTSIAQHVADVSHNGYLSSTDWGTFNSKQAALTIGNLTDVGTDGITVTGGTGAVIGTGTSIAQQLADGSHNGYLSSTDWGTFNSKQSALTIGNLTDAGTDGITVTSGTGAVIGSGTSIAQQVADASHNGYLSSTDWNTFNGKQAAGSYITSGGALGTPSSGTLSNCTSVKGITTGSAVAAGLIGEVISSTQGAGSGITVSGGPTTVTSVPLTAGVWTIYGIMNIAETNLATNHGFVAIGTTTNSFAGTVLGYSKLNFYTLAAAGQACVSLTNTVSISAPTTYYLIGQSDQGSAAAGDWLGTIFGVRVG